MNLSVYDQDLNRVAVIGGQFVSCLWSEGYNSTGSFTLELIQTPEYKQKIRQDYYVGRSDRRTVMVIKSVVFEGGRIVASGKQATRVLDDVACVDTIRAGANIDTAVRTAYNESNKYRRLEFAETNLGIKAAHQISNASFLEVANSLCEDTDLGIKVERAEGGLVAEFYQPPVNENLIFSEQFGNLADPNITLSSENYKNYAVVLGEGSGGERVSVVVDASNGADHREIVIDARDLQTYEGETADQYRSRLAARGIEKLLEYQEVFACKFTPFAGDFGTRYDLGDVLTVHLDGYGLNLQARVSRFTQKSQKNKTTTTIEVGKITIVR